MHLLRAISDQRLIVPFFDKGCGFLIIPKNPLTNCCFYHFLEGFLGVNTRKTHSQAANSVFFMQLCLDRPFWGKSSKKVFTGRPFLGILVFWEVYSFKFIIIIQL